MLPRQGSNWFVVFLVLASSSLFILFATGEDSNDDGPSLSEIDAISSSSSSAVNSSEVIGSDLHVRRKRDDDDAAAGEGGTGDDEEKKGEGEGEGEEKKGEGEGEGEEKKGEEGTGDGEEKKEEGEGEEGTEDGKEGTEDGKEGTEDGKEGTEDGEEKKEEGEGEGEEGKEGEGGDTEGAEVDGDDKKGGDAEADADGKKDGDGDDKDDKKDKKDGDEGDKDKAGTNDADDDKKEKGGKGKKDKDGEGDDEDGPGQDKDGDEGDKQDKEGDEDDTGNGDNAMEKTSKNRKGKKMHSQISVHGQLRCQYNSGRLMASATDCRDLRSDCHSIFPHVHGMVRSPNCLRKDMYKKMMKCAHTCRMCCIRDQTLNGCEDDKHYNCPKKEHKCWQKKYREEMHDRCKKTCGLCEKTKHCHDKVHGCKDLPKNLCKVKRIKNQCAGTCDKCNLKGKDKKLMHDEAKTKCKDKAKNCAMHSGLCRTSVGQGGGWGKKMLEFCAYTCEYCDLKKKCKDRNKKKCKKWNKAQPIPFCANPGYSIHKKEKYCKKTCKLC